MPTFPTVRREQVVEWSGVAAEHDSRHGGRSAAHLMAGQCSRAVVLSKMVLIYDPARPQSSNCSWQCLQNCYGA